MADAARIVLSLLAVVGGCLATAWLARRSRGAVRSGLRVVSRVPVSKGSSLLVVSVGSRMMLVGAAEGNLQLISELDPADLEPATATVPGASISDAAVPQLRAACPPASFLPATSSSPTGRRGVTGPWTGLIRSLQRMTLRTVPEGPSRVHRR